jgi:hypothetical protein
MFNCRYGVCNRQIIADPAEYKIHSGFCSEQCWKNAAVDLNIREWENDKLNYKEIRSRVKKGEITNSEASEFVFEHINQKLSEVLFDHPDPTDEIFSADLNVK